MIAPSLRGAYLAMAEYGSRPEVWQDVLSLPKAGRDAAVIWRAQSMLTAIAPVLEGRACLTRAGARYLGVEWRGQIAWITD